MTSLFEDYDDDGLLGILSSNFLSVQKWIGGWGCREARGIFLHLLSLSSRVNLMHFLAARPNRLLLPNCSELPNFCYCRWLLLRIIKIATAAQQVQLFHFIQRSGKCLQNSEYLGFRPKNQPYLSSKVWWIFLIHFNYTELDVKNRLIP